MTLRIGFGFAALVAALSLASVGCSDDTKATSDGGTGGAGGTGGSGGDSGSGTDGSSGTDSGGGTDSAADAPRDVSTTETSTEGGGGDGGETVSCANYCAKIKTACTAGDSQYISDAACLAMCGAMTPGTYAEGADSVGCRQYHAGNLPASVHCPHAGSHGGGVCSGASRCAAYCKINLALCTGNNAAYADEAACVTACTGWNYTAGNEVGLTSGDSFNCRMYHLQAALDGVAASLTTHCPHTAAASATCQ